MRIKGVLIYKALGKCRTLNRYNVSLCWLAGWQNQWKEGQINRLIPGRMYLNQLTLYIQEICQKPGVQRSLPFWDQALSTEHTPT